jgi:hypothetical protein
VSANDCAWGEETGRVFFSDQDGQPATKAQFDAHVGEDGWHRWVEFKDSDGEFTYVSDDPDGYWLDSDEMYLVAWEEAGIEPEATP